MILHEIWAQQAVQASSKEFKAEEEFSSRAQQPT